MDGTLLNAEESNWSASKVYDSNFCRQKSPQLSQKIEHILTHPPSPPGSFVNRVQFFRALTDANTLADDSDSSVSFKFPSFPSFSPSPSPKADDWHGFGEKENYEAKSSPSFHNESTGVVSI